MKRRRYLSMSVLAGCILLTMMLTSCPSPVDPNPDPDSSPVLAAFPEGFESTAVDLVPKNWTVSPGPDIYAGVVDDISAHAGTHCLKLLDENDTEEAIASAAIMDSTYGQVVFYFMIPSTPAPTASSSVTLDCSSDWKGLVQIIFNNNDRQLMVRNVDESVTPLATYEFDTWHRIEIRWDKSTGYANILFDHAIYGHYPMNNNAQAISRLRFSAGTADEPSTSAMLLIDDITITRNAGSVFGQAFTENFDTTPLDQIPEGFRRRTGDNTFTGVVDNSEVTPHSSPNCCKLMDNSAIAQAALQRDIAPQTYGQLTYYLYVDDSSPWAGMNVAYAASVFFISTRDIVTYLPNGTMITIGTYSTDTWHKITVKWDGYTFRYQVVVDDTDLGSYDFMTRTLPDSMVISCTQGLDFGHLNYVDDVSFTTNPETIP